MKLVVEIVSCFLGKVFDVFYFCQGDAMAGAIQGLSSSSPDLKPLRNLMGHLETSLGQAELEYSQLIGACKAAILSCSEATEELRARMEEEFRRNEMTGWSILGRALSFGFALMGFIASQRETPHQVKTWDINTLMTFAHNFLKEGVADVYATVKNVATQVSSISGVDKGSANRVKISLDNLMQVCQASYCETERSIQDVSSKKDDLAAKI